MHTQRLGSSGREQDLHPALKGKITEGGRSSSTHFQHNTWRRKKHPPAAAAAYRQASAAALTSSPGRSTGSSPVAQHNKQHYGGEVDGTHHPAM
ncbi:hypothetical protein XENTR_v10008863 [Xenopus tropicalis]|nr:hypothetical protein XENTR_v10008863 [Xenopus tropicalis]